MIEKNNLKIKKQYLEKIKILKKYNKSYYNKSNPIVTDSVYDHLKKEIFELEKNYSFLKSKDSPSLKIGYKPSKNFTKVKHSLSIQDYHQSSSLSFFKASIRLRDDIDSSL